MNEHRVPMIGAALRRRVDPALSTNPKVRELVGALAGLDVAPAPRAEFRAELRAQLVAVTPRLVAEGDATLVTPATQKSGRAAETESAPKAERTRRFNFAKPLIAAACILTAFVLLLGGAVLISQHALPGDALYGVKRASEDVEYGTTSGDVDRGKLKLEFAARRIGEVADLLPRASSMGAGVGAVADSGQINSDTADLVRETLSSANGDVYSAAQMLGANAVRNTDSAPLSVITAWTPDQIAAMRQIVARIPAGSLHQRAVETLDVLRGAQARATALRSDLGCSCLDLANSDKFGPEPCTGPCTPRIGGTPTPKPHTSPGTKPGTTTSTPRGSGVPIVPVPPLSSGGSAQPGNTTSAPPKSGHPATKPPAHSSGAPNSSPVTSPSTPGLPIIPTLPGLGGHSSGSGGKNGASQLPISINSCGLSVSIGPIVGGLGGC